MPRTNLVMLAIVLLLTALPFTAAAKQQPWEQEPRPAPAALPAPSFPIPPDGTRLGSMGAVTLQWSLPAGSTQYHLQVIPANGDGPGVNLIRNAEGQFTIPAPPTWYVLLPGMTYTWRVRVTDAAGSVGEGDPSWGPWSPSWRFTTPQPTADTISPTQPPLGTTATSLNPTLVWTDANPGIFYYEIQLSSDPLFNTDAFSATAAVYGNLVHGGATQPANSWTVPVSFPLAPETKHYWRIRPRVQGNGTAVAWSQPFWFTTPGSGSGGSNSSGSQSDLAVSDIRSMIQSVAVGGRLELQYTIRNNGADASLPANVNGLIWGYANERTLDLGPVGTVGALAPQQSSSQTATVAVPADHMAGNFYIGIFVDISDANGEYPRGAFKNNGAGIQIAITAPGGGSPSGNAPSATGIISALRGGSRGYFKFETHCQILSIDAIETTMRIPDGEPVVTKVMWKGRGKLSSQLWTIYISSSPQAQSTSSLLS